MEVCWSGIGRSVIVIATAVVMVVPGATSGATPPAGIKATAPEGTVAADLATTGFMVIDSPTDRTPGRVAITTEQLQVMADEVEAGSGMIGADLDAVTPMPAGAPPFSYLVAAWLHDAPTERAALAASWYPTDTDWRQADSALFPRAVLLLFVADVAEEADGELPALGFDETFDVAGTPSSTELADGFRVAQVADGCALVSGFFTSQVANLFNMLRLSPDFLGGGALGFIGGIVATIWNTAIGLAGDAVQGLIRNLGEPVLQAIGKAIAVAGLIAHVSTYVAGWRIELDAIPSSNRFAVGTEADQVGAVELSDRSERWPWQGELEQCAAALGVGLPQVLEPGDELRWDVVENTGVDGMAPMIIGTTRDDLIPAGARARFSYTTNREERDEGQLRFGRVTITARVPRSELQKALDLAQRLIDDTIAGIVRSTLRVPALADLVTEELGRLLGPALDQLRSAISGDARSVFELVGTTQILVSYHGPPDQPTTTSSPTTAPRTAPPAPTDICGLVAPDAMTSAVGPGGEGFIEIIDVYSLAELSACGWSFDGFGDGATAFVRVITPGPDLDTLRALLGEMGLEPFAVLGWPAYGGESADDSEAESVVVVDLGAWVLQVAITSGDPAFPARLDSAIAVATAALGSAGA